MPIPNRLPTLEDSFLTLKKMGIGVSSVLDVGVLHGTAPLMKVFPDIPHHLFEPVEHFFPQIEKAYKDFDHEIHHVALSNENGLAWQILLSIKNDGRISHSKLSNQPESINEQVIGCHPVRKSKLDNFIASTGAEAPHLLKIDVDGHEIAILEGSLETLKKSNIVVIEATIKNISKRFDFLEKNGFSIFDIVELAYYGGALWQADFVFLSNDIIRDNPNSIPMTSKEYFEQSMWYDYSLHMYRSKE